MGRARERKRTSMGKGKIVMEKGIKDGGRKVWRKRVKRGRT